jgi:hypothetical protein
VSRRRCPTLGFLLLAGCWCVLFFSLSDCKLPTYIMPAYPPLMLVLGYVLVHGRWRASRWPAVTVGVTFLLLGVVHYAALPWYARHHSPMGLPDVPRLCSDRATPVVCFPRNCDSAAFYLGRDDLRVFRSKEAPDLISFLMHRPRTVVLFTHRHSLEELRQVLPAALHFSEVKPMCGSAKFGPDGMCYLAVVERKGP